MADKIITQIETVSSIDIANAEFYVEVDGAFVKTPFQTLLNAVRDEALIDDQSGAMDKTLSAMKIYQLLEGKADSSAKITFAMLDEGAKTELINYIKENVPIDFNITERFIDDTGGSDTTAYSSRAVDEKLKAIEEAGLKADAVQGTHISDDAMEYIVEWIKKAGISFENIPAEGFRFANIPQNELEPVVLTPAKPEIILQPIYTPSNANSGKKLIYTAADSPDLTIDNERNSITSTQYMDIPRTVTAALIDKPEVTKKFYVMTTDKAFTAVLNGTPGDTAPSLINSSSNTGVTLSGGTVYGAGGGLSTNSGKNKFVTSNVPITNSTPVTVKIRMNDMAEYTTAFQDWVKVSWGADSYVQFMLNDNKLDKYALRIYTILNGTQLNILYGISIGNEDGITKPKSAMFEVGLIPGEKRVWFRATGYTDNNFTTKCDLAAENGRYMNNDLTSLWTDATLAEPNLKVELNNSMYYDFSLADLSIEYKK